MLILDFKYIYIYIYTHVHIYIYISEVLILAVHVCISQHILYIIIILCGFILVMMLALEKLSCIRGFSINEFEIFHFKECYFEIKSQFIFKE